MRDEYNWNSNNDYNKNNVCSWKMWKNVWFNCNLSKFLPIKTDYNAALFMNRNCPIHLTMIFCVCMLTFLVSSLCAIHVSCTFWHEEWWRWKCSCSPTFITVTLMLIFQWNVIQVYNEQWLLILTLWFWIWFTFSHSSSVHHYIMLNGCSSCTISIHSKLFACRLLSHLKCNDRIQR